MKKRSLLMLLSGMLFVSGGFVSCDDSDDVDKVNKLEVSPSSTIQFEASDNTDVVLKVTTDAKSWTFTNPDWVTAKQDGDKLTVNAKANTTESTRVGRIEISAGNAEKVAINVSQRAADPDVDVLSVDPTDDIAFLAKGNTDIVLTVTTNAASWDVEAPEWVVATKDGNKLTVNAKENTETGSRAGRLTFTAGEAKAVSVNVSQKGAEDKPAPGEKVAASLKDESGESNVTFTATGKEEGGILTANVKFALEKAAAADASVEIFVDEAYLAEYNFINKTNCVLFPGEITIANNGAVKIAAGATDSDNIAVGLNVNHADVKYNTEYLIPLYVKVKSDNVAVSNETCRVNYILKKKNPKEVKNVLYFEVNDTNPLNALEYVMADGSYFFDAIILFAANINYSSAEDRVYLNNNPNVQALLDETDVYLQPLREKGIKVYLGLLGNHDISGLCQLSDWGCEQFALELALACQEYKLDGINFDDEYSGYPDTSNKWFTYPSSVAGARLCYETKKALKENVAWETEVSTFSYGYFGSAPTINVDGTFYNAGSYLDFWVANYGGSTRPAEGMTKKQCSGYSVECNRGYGGMSESYARSIKENGYGWIMWFAFTPVGTEKGSGSVPSNLSTSLPQMKGTALGLYDQELLDPTGYYLKIGQGEYDPVRHEF